MRLTRKDLFLATLRVIVGFCLISYLIFLYLHWVKLVPNKSNFYNLIIMWVLFLLWLFILLMWIFRFCFKKPRLVQFIAWIFIILFANYSWIIDYPQNQYVFLKDILNFLGFLAVVLSFSKLCIYDKCMKKQIEEKKQQMEVIEV
jgi:hypothetical protein